jgi:hypothetical protein
LDEQVAGEPLRDAILPVQHQAIAPDGSLVRLLVQADRGSLAHFELGAGEASRPQRHSTVTEIWYVIEGLGQMWRSTGTASIRLSTCGLVSSSPSPSEPPSSFETQGVNTCHRWRNDAALAGRRRGDGIRRSLESSSLRPRRRSLPGAQCAECLRTRRGWNSQWLVDLRPSRRSAAENRWLANRAVTPTIGGPVRRQTRLAKAKLGCGCCRGTCHSHWSAPSLGICQPMLPRAPMHSPAGQL